MPREIKILEGFNEMTEEFGFGLGEAEDFLDRVGPMVADQIELVALGRVNPAEAKRKIAAEFDNARRDIQRWRDVRGWAAAEYNFRYIDADMIPLTNPKAPFIRIITELPTDRNPGGAA